MFLFSLHMGIHAIGLIIAGDTWFFWSLNLNRRMNDTESDTYIVDIGKRIRIHRSTMSAQRQLAMTDGPNVQVMDIGYVGSLCNRIVDLLPQNVWWHFFEQDRNGASQDSYRRIDNQDTKPKSQYRINYMPIWPHPDYHSCNEYCHALGQVGHGMKVGSS
jgi:hypothetical protein